mgnify:CR=1 FL=1
MNGIICRAIISGNGVDYATEKIENNKAVGKIDQTTSSIDTIILSDKKFGVLKPKNGVYFTYKALNKDVEITDKNVDRAIKNAFNRWSFPLNFSYKRAKDGEAVDFTFEFRSESEDSILNSSTLAYMHYPIGGLYNGKCVINTRFWWTLSGSGVDLHLQDPIHYTTPTGKTQGQSWDLDKVLGHELGHGLLGLQHFIEGLMAYRYDLMTEITAEVDITRGSQKIPKRNIIASLLKRKFDFLKIFSDRDLA